VGVVYDAIHRELGRRVALKILHRSHADDPLSRERVRGEAPAAARVRHDHIVPIYEAGEVGSELFYAMALIEERTLADLIRDGACPPHAELATQFAQVADALHLLHEQGIVHRDVKPPNLMLDAQGRLVLGDFGLARSTDAGTLTETGRAVGTPLYMSPEQISASRGEEGVDGRSDVYALGASLYEALTGSVPFKGRDLISLLARKMRGRPEPPRKLDPAVPRALDQVVMVCLERDREDRYATAADLAADLRAFAKGQEPRYGPVPWWKRCIRSVVAHPLWAAGAVLLMAAGAFLWTALTRDDMATLEVESVAGAAVQVNAGAFSPAPVAVRVPPGEVAIVLRLAGHEDRHVPPFRVEAGRHYARSYEGFSIRDVDDPSVLEQAALANGWNHPLPVSPRERLSVSRSQRKFDVFLAFPLGTVRAADLDRYRVELGDDYEQAGHVRFLRGDEELWRSERARSRELDGGLPEAVRAGLRPGETITWGYYPEEGGPVVAQIVIAGADVEPSLSALDEQLTRPEAPQPPAVRAWFRAQELIAADLPSSAVAEVERARGAGVTSLSLLHLEAALLRLLHANALPSLQSTVLWGDLARAHGEGLEPK
jgi:hypothetical protein